MEQHGIHINQLLAFPSFSWPTRIEIPHSGPVVSRHLRWATAGHCRPAATTDLVTSSWFSFNQRWQGWNPRTNDRHPHCFRLRLVLWHSMRLFRYAVHPSMPKPSFLANTSSLEGDHHFCCWWPNYQLLYLLSPATPPFRILFQSLCSVKKNCTPKLVDSLAGWERSIMLKTTWQWFIQQCNDSKWQNNKSMIGANNTQLNRAWPVTDHWSVPHYDPHESKCLGQLQTSLSYAWHFAWKGRLPAMAGPSVAFLGCPCGHDCCLIRNYLLWRNYKFGLVLR